MRRLLACLCLIACGTDAEPPAPEPDAGVQVIGACDGPVTVDGVFTGWPECREYVARLAGVHADLYVRYAPPALFVLSDWHSRADAIEDCQHSAFHLTTGKGTQVWNVRVFGDQRIEVDLNGQNYPGSPIGGAGLGGSLGHEEDHAIYEFSLDAPSGFLTMTTSAPGDGAAGCDAVTDEPTVFAGKLQPDGDVDVAGATGPVLANLAPKGGPPGEPVTVHGHNLGAKAALITIGGAAADVVSWSDTLIELTVPETKTGASDVVVDLDGVLSNPLAFQVN